MYNLKKLSKENEQFFKEIYFEVRTSSRFEECSKFIQHGNTSVKQHVIMVTLLALNLSEKLHIKVDKKALIRGALLHDYYLYDWHNKSLKDLHGFHHPKRALRQALKEFDLTNNEIDIITKHMFPLTPFPPRYREAILVCIADKICAWGETIEGRLSLNL